MGNGGVWSDAGSSGTDGTSSILPGDGQSSRDTHRMQEEMQFLNSISSLFMNHINASPPHHPLLKKKQQKKQQLKISLKIENEF